MAQHGNSPVTPSKSAAVDIPRATQALSFPHREVVAAAFDAYRTNPVGLIPTAKLWQEIGVLPGMSVRDETLVQCVRDGCLLEPSRIWGVPTGYLPGPAAFGISNISTAVDGLSRAPTLEEVRNHANTRMLTLLAQALEDPRGRNAETPIVRAFHLNRAVALEVLTTLIHEGLVVREGNVVKSTQKLKELVGQRAVFEELVMPSAGAAGALFPHQSRAAEREALYATLKPELVALVAEQPGLRLSEILREAQKLPNWPSHVTRGVLENIMVRLATEKHIAATPMLKFGMPRGFTYSPAQNA